MSGNRAYRLASLTFARLSAFPLLGYILCVVITAEPGYLHIDCTVEGKEKNAGN